MWNLPAIRAAASATSGWVMPGARSAFSRDGGDHGQQVGLSGPVVADDEKPFVVHGHVKLELWDHYGGELLRHLPGDYEGLH